MRAMRERVSVCVRVLSQSRRRWVRGKWGGRRMEGAMVRDVVRVWGWVD